MKYLIDKIIIAALCAAIQIYTQQRDTDIIIAVLVALIASSLIQSVNFKHIKYALEAAYIVFCIAFSPGVFMLPLILYDTLCNERKLSLLFLLLPIINEALQGNYLPIIASMIIAGVAFWLFYKTQALEKTKQALIVTRDTGVELNQRLNKQNKELIENQDNKIYLATLQERNRISREIHDNVGHLLSRSILQIAALIAITDGEKLPMHKTQLLSVKETLDSAMDSTRKSVHNMHNDSIDLTQSVNEILLPMRTRYEVSTDYDFSGNVPGNIKLCFIATVKEACSNVVKHSDATKITVMIREHPAFYQLTFIDNGQTTKNSSTDGMGLSNMRERVDALGGIFRVEHTSGFKIFISIQKEKA